MSPDSSVSPTASLQWVFAPSPADNAVGFTARLLSTLLSRTAVIVNPERALPDRHLPTIWYLEERPPDRPAVLWIHPDREFWNRVATGADITPRSTAEWGQTLYPVWGRIGGREEGCCPVDPIAASFFHVSRIEEWRSQSMDRHRRYPAEEAWMVRTALIERPLVHDYAAGVGRALHLTHPIAREAVPWPGGRRFAVAFTHDIDRMAMHGPLWQDIGRAVKGLRSPGGIGAAIRRFRSRRRVRRGARDPFDTFARLIDLHHQHGFRATFFIINASPSRRNADYAISRPDVVQLLKLLRGRGFEIGLHASYECLEHPERLASELSGLISLSDGPVETVRQHYLRLQAARTWKVQCEAGLQADTTLGFASRFGFRAGLAVPFQPWDFASNRPFDIWEVPLIMMDGTAREYMRLSPQEAGERSRHIIGCIAEVGGGASLLWHNSSLDDVDWPGWDEVYEGWLDETSSRNGWGATLSAIVAVWKERVGRLGNGPSTC
ncbi:MAG: polysaccharide deacetylase family protein [Candidatus Zixiibacteriota bacterium]